MTWEQLLRSLELTIIFSVLGVLLFAISFWILVRVAPFSVRKEIEEDQNLALGVIIAAMILGIAMIVSAAIQS